ncbi:MAG: hypothetical protein IJO42_00590 [Clostridia bacterium]|nr:hypothetical protein [Clostridia bacterium]
MKAPVEDSAAFMNIPLSAQALWFHLCIRAEWDGLHYRIRKQYAHHVREDIGATADDVRTLIRNELILDYEGYIYLENVALYPGPVTCENGVKEVEHIFPGTRLQFLRERVSEYRQRSVFDLDNS